MTAQHKYYGSIGLAILLLLALWVFGIRKTLAERSSLAQNQILQQRIENADLLIRDYQKSIDLFGEASTNELPYSEESLFSQIEQIVSKHNGEILGYLPQPDNQLENALVKTKRIEIRGDYFDLVKCLHDIEQNPGIAKVLSSKMEMVDNRKTRKRYLVLELYIQNVIMS